MDLRAQLQDHLGDAFRIERELGGGGMSRVFVATETRLSRLVVVKVLSPELAQGLNAQRFEREILLAASLQQANIVPVLAAGDVAGLPYFTMPFVDGESLRNRIGRGMPLDDVIAILRDVAKALAYAHQRGIVHRDIKPDNVLLSGGTAVVTDFGIAKALSASRTDGGDNATLTSVGTSIGTPAYMAPEQVAGDPNLDHRVDLYALGCMAFELLTGKSPFGDHPPQRMLAAHLSEAPAPVETLRPDCPPAVALLVARLLEKDPADRLGSAQEVVQALGSVATTSSESARLTPQGRMLRSLGAWAVATLVVWIVARAAVVGIGLPSWTVTGAVGLMLLGLPVLLVTGWAKWMARKAAAATPTLTPGGGMAPRPPSGTMATIAIKANRHLSFRRATRGGIYAMVGFVVLIATFMITRAMGVGPAASLFAAGTLNAQDKVVLADFAAEPGDSALVPVVVEAVRAAMSQSQAVRVLSQSDVASALGEMRRDVHTPLTPDVARELATRAGAKAILGGRLVPAGAGYIVSLELTNAASGDVLASFRGTANQPERILDVVDDLTRKLRGKMGESLRQVQASVPLARATTSSLAALRKFSEAARLNDVDRDFDGAERAAREAVALDSTFAMAWRKLAVAMKNNARPQASIDSALAQGFRYADRLPPLEHGLVVGAYYRDNSTAADRGKALEAYRSVYAIDSMNSTALNNLSTIYASRLEFDSAAYYSGHGPMVDRGDPVSRLQYAVDLVNAGHQSEAKAILDSVQAGFVGKTIPPAVALFSVRVAIGLELPDSVITGYLRAAEQSGSEIFRFFGEAVRWQLASQAGHVAESEKLGRTLGQEFATRTGVVGFGVWGQGLLALSYGRDPAVVVRRADSLLASPAWRDSPPGARPYVAVAVALALAGEPVRARAVLARRDADLPDSAVGSARQDLLGARAEIALAAGDPTTAIALFRQAGMARDGAPTDHLPDVVYGIARGFDALDQADSTIAYLERYLALPRLVRRDRQTDPRALAAVHKRLGELYDAKGERAKAIDQYQAFVDQWATADQELQPTVASVRSRLRELQQREGT